MEPLDYGIQLVERFGLSIFPLAPRSKVPCVEGGRNAHTKDVDDLREFAKLHPNCNYGIATGSDVGGLFAIDCDVDDSKGEDGISTVKAWEASHGEFPEGPVSTTPRGGMHILFYSDTPVSCSTNSDAGVDVRGDGGYIVGPGSILNNGEYEWDMDIEDYAIPNADANVMHFLSSIQKHSNAKRGKFKLPDKIQPGGRNDTLYRYACSLRANYVDEDLIIASVMGVNTSLCKPPLSQAEIEKIVESACTHKEGKSKEIEKRINVSRMLQRNKSGSAIPSITNCMTVINNDTRLAGRFKYNTFSYTKMVQLPLPWDGGSGVRQLKDVDYTQLCAWLESNYYLIAKQPTIDAVTNTCFDNKFNPVTEWLSSLKWDGEDRIPDILPIFLGADKTEYNTGVMRLFMHGACARADTPGCKFDTMMILVGPQGIGKSTFLRLLAHNSQWFNDNLNTIKGDEAIEKIRGMWIAEMAELLASKGVKDVEAVKAFVSGRVDTIRPKYGRETEQRPRTCVLAGTTNDWQFLSDPTGNRRFLPIVCKAKRMTDAMMDEGAPKFIEQCWAQAWYEWKSGEYNLILPSELAEQADNERTEHTEDDPRIGVIGEYLDRKANAAGNEQVRVCVTELLEQALSIPDAKNAQKKLIKEIHQIMSNMDGWKRFDGNKTGKARTSYGVQVCYVPENDDVTATATLTATPTATDEKAGQ